MNIQPGDKIRIYFNKGNSNNQLLHVLGIFDEDQIACKEYYNFKWIYKFYSIYHLQVFEKNGILKIIKGEK
jgi:hypothetical protein